MPYLPYQLVQDFFHQQYDQNSIWSYPNRGAFISIDHLTFLPKDISNHSNIELNRTRQIIALPKLNIASKKKTDIKSCYLSGGNRRSAQFPTVLFPVETFASCEPSTPKSLEIVRPRRPAKGQSGLTDWWAKGAKGMAIQKCWIFF